MNKPLHTPKPVRLPEWLAQLKSEMVNVVPDDAIESVIDAARGVADFDTVRHELAIRRMERLIKSQQTNIAVGDTKTSRIVADTLRALRVVKRFHGDMIDDCEADQQSAWEISHQAWSAAWQDVQLAWSTRSTAKNAHIARAIAQSAANAAKSANWSTELSLSKSEAMSASLAALTHGWQPEIDALLDVLRGAK